MATDSPGSGTLTNKLLPLPHVNKVEGSVEDNISCAIFCSTRRSTKRLAKRAIWNGRDDACQQAEDHLIAARLAYSAALGIVPASATHYPSYHEAGQ
ncbi:unnamed protein product [Peniophora sp. CBMAI 1063]|nr:unnamed protein product [Peniophora sp. CBMAI 1063]